MADEKINVSMNDAEPADFEDYYKDYEPGNSDKLFGIFVEPKKMLSLIVYYKLKLTTWAIPFALFFIVAVFSQFVKLNHPSIRGSLQESIMRNYNTMLHKYEPSLGDIEVYLTRSMASSELWNFIILKIAYFVIFTLIIYLIAKLILHDKPTFHGAFTAFGIAHYILIIQAMAALVLSFVFNKFLYFIDFSVILEFEKYSFAGFFMSKLDPFTFWFLIVAGIGFAKMFDSKWTTKYISLCFAVWFITDGLLYYFAQLFPVLSIIRH